MLDTKADATIPSFFSQFGIRKQYTFALMPITFWGRLITHLVINLENYPQNMAQGTDLKEAPALDWSYWATGMLCSQNGTDLLYCIEAIKAGTEPFMEGLEIRAPNTPKGSFMMQTLTFTIESLLRNWYPTLWKTVEIWIPCSYCIHRRTPEIPSISFSDALQAVSKGVGVKCANHPEKVVSIAKLIPDLFQHKVNKEYFIPPGAVEFNPSDKSTCLSPLNSETVFKGHFNGSLVAVKPYPHPVPNPSNMNADCSSSNTLALVEMWQECQAIQTVQSSGCPYLISLLGICQSPLCLVFPFAKWSSLEDVIQDKDIYISLMVRIRMLHQLTAALLSIHSQNMIHRHICLANILVTSLSPDDPVNIKLAGFSETCHTMFQGISKGYHGSFSAPEMSQEFSSDYDERVDIFAFAFVSYEIITRRRMHMNFKVSLLKILFHPVRPTLAPIVPRLPYFASILSRCWNVDRTMRPFAGDVAEFFKDPVHILTRDGYCISKKHSFFAGTAKFTRTAHGFSSDIFLCTGALSEGTEKVTLSHLSLPGLTLKKTATIPSLFIICMCCIENQLWVSIYGKKVLVYSTATLEYRSEFIFKQHVVAMAVSPTQVYLGLENGVLQVYDVSTDTVPTEPILTKIVCQGQEFKCIEPMEDCVVCATRDTIYKLHPDLLHTVAKWPIVAEAEIRNVIITRFTDDDDTIWISFRRLDRIEVRKANSGDSQYTIECSRVVEMKSSDVWVVTMRVVLDTVWIGLNTGHILIFSTIGSQPHMLTHFKLHDGNVRQLLLLHPSYMGPSSIEGVGERLTANSTSTHTPYDEQVCVLSCGEGLIEQLPELSEAGTLAEVRDSTSETTEENKENLYAVILEGMCETRVTDMENKTGRPVVAYARPPEMYYSVPAREFDTSYDNPAFRTSTWSATSQRSPIESEVRKISSHNESGLYESIRHWIVPEAKKTDTFYEEIRQESPPTIPPRILTAQHRTTSPVQSRKHLPKIPERDGEGTAYSAPLGGSATLGQVHSHSPAHVDTRHEDNWNAAPASSVDKSKDIVRPTFAARSKLDAYDSCEDDDYDPYVSMVSVLKSREHSIPSPERKEPGSGGATGFPKPPRRTPPPLPPKPKGKTSPPTPPKKQRTSAGVGDHLEQQ
jgi:serine/threonine protein kinase